MRFDGFFKLCPKLCHSLGVRDAGEGLPTSGPIRVTGETPEPRGVFRQGRSKLLNGIVVV